MPQSHQFGLIHEASLRERECRIGGYPGRNHPSNIVTPEDRASVQFPEDAAEHALRLERAFIAIEGQQIVEIERNKGQIGLDAVARNGARLNAIEEDARLRVNRHGILARWPAGPDGRANNSRLDWPAQQIDECGRYRRNCEMVDHHRLLLVDHRPVSTLTTMISGLPCWQYVDSQACGKPGALFS